jgi:hypothetical protein
VNPQRCLQMIEVTDVPCETMRERRGYYCGGCPLWVDGDGESLTKEEWDSVVAYATVKYGHGVRNWTGRDWEIELPTLLQQMHNNRESGPNIPEGAS